MEVAPGFWQTLVTIPIRRLQWLSQATRKIYTPMVSEAKMKIPYERKMPEHFSNIHNKPAGGAVSETGKKKN